MRNLLIILSAFSLAACEAQKTVQDQFMDHLSALCGQSFEGKVISNDEADADWAKEVLTMHIRDCSDDEIKIPLHVGENRSRTWIITDNGNGLTLKHDHRHEDGEPDAVTMYGGDTASDGTDIQQTFPVDQFSKDMFMREGLDVSITNTWILNIEPGETFTYALSRENRDFRAQFNLTKPVETPPPPWGSE